MRRLGQWWLILLLWMALSAMAVAGESFTQSLRGQVISELCLRVPYIQAEDCSLQFTHSEQALCLEEDIQSEGLVWQVAVSELESLVGPIALPVDLYKNGQLLRRVVLAAHTEVWVPVVQAARDVAKGSLITDADVCVERRLLTTVPYHSYRRVRDVASKQARLSLRQGTLLMPWMLGNPALVYRNDPVQILLKGDHFTLEVRGIAMQDGGPDDMIRVRHNEQVLLARVLDDRQVLVTTE
jgi:flagella basal body P-ring formation protein FlgA